jgi:hypothetical protein
MCAMSLLRLFFRQGAKPKAEVHLSEAEVLVLARQALGGSRPLRVMLVHSDAGAIWSVSEVALGSGGQVRIDDATGKVLSRERWGVR